MSHHSIQTMRTPLTNSHVEFWIPLAKNYVTSEVWVFIKFWHNLQLVNINECASERSNGLGSYLKTLVILSRMEWFPFPLVKFLILLLCILAGLIGLYILCEIGYCIHWYYWFYCIKKKKEATQPESISDQGSKETSILLSFPIGEI